MYQTLRPTNDVVALGAGAEMVGTDALYVSRKDQQRGVAYPQDAPVIPVPPVCLTKLRQWLPGLEVRDMTYKCKDRDSLVELLMRLRTDASTVAVIRINAENTWLVRCMKPGVEEAEAVLYTFVVRGEDFCHLKVHHFYDGGGQAARRMLQRTIAQADDVCPICMEQRSKGVVCDRCGVGWCNSCDTQLRRPQMCPMCNQQHAGLVVVLETGSE